MDEIFASQMREVERSKIVVDTTIPPGVVEPDGPFRTLIGADNSFSEWSAADGAVAAVGRKIWNYDLVHIGTAAFQTLYTAYLSRFDTRLLSTIARKPVCVGHIDCYNDPIGVLSYNSQHWLRTSFVFMPPAELLALGSLVSFRRRESLFSGDPAHPFRDDAPLSMNYRDYITTWLTGGDIGQGVQWHSSFALCEEALPAFERKALAIINEHLFSIRLRRSGCRTVDVTWLATRLRRNPDIEPPWHYSWNLQLAERDTDPLTLQSPAASDNAGRFTPPSPGTVGQNR